MQIFMGTDLRLLATWKVRNLKIDKLVKNYKCVWFLTALLVIFFCILHRVLVKGKMITCEIPAKKLT